MDTPRPWRLRRLRRTFVAAAAVGAAAAAPACAAPTFRWRSSLESAGDDRKPPRRPPRMIRPARLVALPGASPPDFVAVEPDGTRRLIVEGMRLLEGPGGTLRRGRELFPQGRAVKTVKLPDRLGGGHLFYSVSGGTTHIWLAKAWTSRLEPLARMDFEVDRIVPGFDRLYLVLRSSAEVVALDPRTGRAGGTGSLPAASAFGAMAFADEWMGAVWADYRGVLVTFDAGASWRSAGLVTTEPHVGLENDRVILYTARGRFTLDASGRLRQHTYGSSDDSLFSGVGRLAVQPRGFAKAPIDRGARPPANPLGRLPLREAVLHGWPESATTAVVASRGVLGRVRLSDGGVLEVVDRAAPVGADCQAMRLGEGVGFVCGRERGETTLYEVVAPLALRPVLSFPDPRFVSASGNGGVVIRGGCRPDVEPVRDRSTTYCVRSPSGRLREVRVRGDLGVERVVALKDGRTAVLVPPRRGAAGALTLVDTAGGSKTVKLRLPTTGEASLRALLRKGLWMDGFQQVGKSLAGWVAAAGPFVGVRVRLDGAVRAGPMAEDIDRSLVSGQFALYIGRPGVASETTDGGFSWREVEVPTGVAERGGGLPQRGRTGASSERGCTPVGCAFGSWLRVGWGGKGKEAELPDAEEPGPTVLPPSRGGRWLVRCEPTGVASRIARPASVPPAPRAVPSRFALPPPGAVSPVEPRSSSWAPFYGVAPPRRSADQVGLDFGTEGRVVQLRAYAWGVKGADWRRAGRWQIRALDPFDVQGAIWSTAATRSPWRDASTAAAHFGQGAMRGLPASWNAALDPSGRAGILAMVVAGARVELFLFEEGRPIVSVPAKNLWGASPVSGAVRARDAWYVGLGGGAGRDFRVLRVSGDGVARFGSYTRAPRTSAPAWVVRTVRGDSVGIWVADRKTRGSATRWYVFPLDPGTGQAGEPLELTPAVLGRTPPPCGPDDGGWVLTGEAPIEPYVDFAPPLAELSVRAVRVRVLASEGGLCLDALTATIGEPMSRALAHAAGARRPTPPGKPTVRLSLRGSAQSFRFRCTH